MSVNSDVLKAWWSSRTNTFSGSVLVWAMIVIILVFWSLNLREEVMDYQDRMAQRVDNYQNQLLNRKQEELEQTFRAVYEHIRTLSLLPSLRSVAGENLKSASEDVIEQGRLSLDTHQTIQQVYRNLAHNVNLSEIYYVLTGFDPDAGETPFFMYDDEIVGVHAEDGLTEQEAEDIPEEYELDEYAYYVRQLAWFEQHYTHWNSGDISRIPALSSPLMRTCDNTQYGSIAKGDERDSFGILYSLPVYGLGEQRLRGIISTVLRANVLEAKLLGRPYIPLSDQEKAAATAQGWALPDIPVGFILTNSQHHIRIYDRRNHLLETESVTTLRQLPGRLVSRPLNVISDGHWELSHYLSSAQIAELNKYLVQSMWVDILARIGLLLAMLVIFWKANRDQRRHHAALVKMAHYDTLTLLPNRRLLYQHLEQSMARARRHHCRLGLLFLDIDDFGSINDTLGPQTGDQVLTAIAERLRHSVRLSDDIVSVERDIDSVRIARLGGDDFALIFEDIDKPETAVLLALRTMQLFQGPIELDGQPTEISLSGGMAIYPDDAACTDDLMACADYALREATLQGIGQFQMYNDDMRQRAARQTQLMRDLPDAVRSELFTLEYQAKQQLDDDNVMSFEVLLRWTHPEFGLVSPVEFIPLLEQSGLIVDAGRWVMLSACQQLKSWHDAGYSGLCVSVNVSPRQLMLSDILSTVDEVLNETGVPPQTLILEITESMMIDNLDEGNRTLAQLRERGVKLAIDDFGTGYSSLTYLLGMPVDYLKLDKSMIDVIDNAKGAHVIKTTIALAHGLGLRAIAEGVEEQVQRDVLKAMGCDMIQGYWLSRPLPVDRLQRFMAKHCRPQGVVATRQVS